VPTIVARERRSISGASAFLAQPDRGAVIAACASWHNDEPDSAQ
jgi:hypothetical protein